MKKILYLTLLLLILSTCTSNSANDTTPLKIAVLAPLHGDYELLGAATRNGVVLAVEERNREGGVLGRPVQVVLEDSACDYKTGRAVALRAITQQKAHFIIGPVCANAAEGVAQVAMEEGALHINHAAVNLDLTLDSHEVVRPLVFRVPLADPVQGHAMALFAMEHLAATTAAIVTLEESVYAGALAAAFEQAFVAGGGEIVARKTYVPDTQVFYEILEPVRDENPDVVYMPGYALVINQLTEQARMFGLAQPFLGSDGWDTPDLSPEVIRPAYFTVHYTPLEPRAEVRTWIAKYEARYIVPPDVVATLAYDAANILLAAIVEADSLEPETVAATLETMTFEAITGVLTFDDAHNAVKDVLVLTAQDGVVRFETRLSLLEE